jgi:uncharacterized membrane-anchored protein
MPRPTTLPEPWRSLAERLGGVQALADALHSAPRTIRQWAHHERTPGRLASAAILALFLAHSIPPPEGLS